jgi:hypothetical protein
MKQSNLYLGCLYLGLVLLSLDGLAQIHRFSGQVVDSKTHQPVSNVNISIAGSRAGGISGEDGSFSLATDTLPVNLLLSHVSYKTQRIWMERETTGMMVLMEPKVAFLEEVEISGTHEPYPFFKDEKYTVLDYQVDRGLVYLLVYRFRRAKSELLCQTFSGDTLLSPFSLPFKPTSLFRDCMGYLHVLSKDSIYQIYMGKESMNILYRYDIESFHRSLENCMVASEDVMYFRKQSPDRLTVDFYMVDRHNGRRQVLTSTTNQELSEVLSDNPGDYIYLISERIPDGRDNMVEYVWVRTILYKPNRSVMFQIGDSLCVFNVTEGIMELYDMEGSFVNKLSLPIEKSMEGEWTQDVHIDAMEHQAFTSSMKNGHMILYQVDLQTGALHRMLKTIHAFPEKVNVYGGYLLYLYDKPWEGDEKYLYRQKI